MRSPGMDTRGSYFGGLNNMSAIDLFDVPPHAAGFDRIAVAADQEMLAVISGDLEYRITERQVSDFVNVTES